MAEIELSARIGALIVQHAATRGVDPERLQKSTGFDPRCVADPDARISLAREEALWNEAARLGGDPDFGIHTAESLLPGAFDVLDYAIRSAPTVRAALERVARYNRLQHDAAIYELKELGPILREEHRFAFGPGEQCRHSAEFTLAAHIVISAQLTGTRLLPRAVEFRHARPADSSEHVRLFGVEPSFLCATNALEWFACDLERPVLSADPALSRVIERHAQALLDAQPRRDVSYADRVRHELAHALGQGDATLKSTAKRLRIAERSLQRRLASEGVSFDALLDELRRELAVRYLADRTIAIAEVAYLLGYSEPSPFHRAVRRWTGRTPSELREPGLARQPRA